MRDIQCGGAVVAATFKIKCKGTKYFDDSEESGIDWIVLESTNLNDQDLLCMLNFESYYGGVGRYFRQDANVRRTNTRVLVKQFWGYDI